MNKAELQNLIKRFKRLKITKYRLAKLVKARYGSEVSERQVYRILDGTTTGERYVKKAELINNIIKEMEN